MKKIAIIALTIFFTNNVRAQTVFTNDQKLVQQAVIQLFEAISERDSVLLKASCTSDITLYEYGQVWNIDTLIRKTISLNKAADFKRANSFTFINTTIDKSIAWITYRLNSSIFREGKQTNLLWLETVALVKINRKWKIRHLHSTRIK